MTKPKLFSAGDFCWADIASPNIQSTQSFYQTLFNWDFLTQQTEMDYTFFKLNQVEMCGGFEITPSMKTENVLPCWNSYIMVKNVDETVAKAQSLGANILKPAMDVVDAGRMAVIQDPTGAVFCIWQSKKNNNSDVLSKQTPGMFSWFELMTTDTEKAKSFYSALFGWKTETQNIPDGTVYTSFINNGEQIAGMLAITDDMKNMPPMWNIYFTVDNFDAVAKKATQQGAHFVYEPKEIPDVGRFGMLKDPQGICFSIIQYSQT